MEKMNKYRLVLLVLAVLIHSGKCSPISYKASPSAKASPSRNGRRINFFDLQQNQGNSCPQRIDFFDTNKNDKMCPFDSKSFAPQNSLPKNMGSKDTTFHGGGHLEGCRGGIDPLQNKKMLQNLFGQKRPKTKWESFVDYSRYYSNKILDYSSIFFSPVKFINNHFLGPITKKMTFWTTQKAVDYLDKKHMPPAQNPLEAVTKKQMNNLTAKGIAAIIGRYPAKFSGYLLGRLSDFILEYMVDMDSPIDPKNENSLLLKDLRPDNILDKAEEKITTLNNNYKKAVSKYKETNSEEDKNASETLLVEVLTAKETYKKMRKKYSSLEKRYKTELTKKLFLENKLFQSNEHKIKCGQAYVWYIKGKHAHGRLKDTCEKVGTVYSLFQNLTAVVLLSQQLKFRTKFSAHQEVQNDPLNPLGNTLAGLEIAQRAADSYLKIVKLFDLNNTTSPSMNDDELEKKRTRFQTGLAWFNAISKNFILPMLKTMSPMLQLSQMMQQLEQPTEEANHNNTNQPPVILPFDLPHIKAGFQIRPPAMNEHAPIPPSINPMPM